MHRAVNMRFRPLAGPPRLLLRRIAGDTSAPAPLSACRPHQRPPSWSGAAVHIGGASAGKARGICSTSPVCKGRRGGASALMPKRSGPLRRKVPGAGKKKRPKVHGAPMSRLNLEQRNEKDRLARMEAMKAISPEDRARVQEMTEAFLNAPLGAEDVTLNKFLRKKDPDVLMLNLGMTLAGSNGITSGNRENKLSLSAGGQSSPPPPPPLYDVTEAAIVGPGAPPGSDATPLSWNESPESWHHKPAGMYGAPPPLPSTSYPSYPAGHSSALPDGGNAAVGLATRRSGGCPGTEEDFNFLVRTLGAHKRLKEARTRVLPEMKRRGITPTKRTFFALLAGAAFERDPDAAEEIWSEMMASGVKPSGEAWYARVDAHAKGSRMRRAFALGREMREEGHPWHVTLYTSLITGCTRGRDYAGAWRLWTEMTMWGEQPNLLAYNAMIKLCAETRQYEKAMSFLDEMDMEGIRPSKTTIEMLIRAAATAPQWIRAYGTIVDDLVQRFIGLGITPDIDTYRALLRAYSAGGDADKVLQCIEEAHELEGLTGDLLGDGTPKLPWNAYCDAIRALAMCTSAGMHRGTRTRWGILPGEDALVMDISTLDVAEEDYNRIRQMQMSAMEWDEVGEAALKKGFRKGTRTKFRGVTTPDALIGDDEYERAIESEYELVMQKTKAMKEIERRDQLVQLGIDPDAEDKVAKTRPRILPDPRDKEHIGAPVPHWLSADPEAPPMGPIPPTASLEQKQQYQLGISDGLEGRGGAGDGAEEVGGDESLDDDGEDEEYGDEGFFRSAGDARVRGGWGDLERGQQEEEEDEGMSLRESWRREDQPREGGDAAVRGANRSSRGGIDGNPGSILKRVTMLEGHYKRGGGMGSGDDRGEPRGSTAEEDGGLKFPENLKEMMEEVRMLAQQDLDRRRRRHSHSSGEEDAHSDDEDGSDIDVDGNDEGWEAEGERGLEEEDEEGFGMKDEGAGAERGGPEAQADAAFQEMMAELKNKWDAERKPKRQSSDGGGGIDVSVSFDGSDDDEDDGGDGDFLPGGVNDGSSLIERMEQDEGEEEYEDWVPLMHKGLNERNNALMGVVKLLEVDAMAAARKADEEKGFGVGGPREWEGAGPAVQAMLGARLMTLTESRKRHMVHKFIEEEYPKEGAKFDLHSVELIVNMYINTRDVEFAEQFVELCMKEYGLKPSRSTLGPILNARARRAVAWTNEIANVGRILDTMQEHRIKPHENDLRFVRKLVDKGKFEHSWLPVDPNAKLKKMMIERKKSLPKSKAYFKVKSHVKNAKFIQGKGRGKSRVE